MARGRPGGALLHAARPHRSRGLPAELSPRICPCAGSGSAATSWCGMAGITGVVISTLGTLDRLERTSHDMVYGEAGVACARIARQCIKWGLGPAEFFAGIPGTLGGALAMNAGAFGGETWRHVVEVETIDRGGREHRRHRERVSGELSPRGGAGGGGMVPRRQAAIRGAAPRASQRGGCNCSRSARRRSRSASGAAARCSLTRRAITPRASSRPPA